MLQRELDRLPAKIEALEAEIAELDAQVSKPDFYENDFETVVEPALRELNWKRAELERAVERWAELEGMASGQGTTISPDAT